MSARLLLLDYKKVLLGWRRKKPIRTYLEKAAVWCRGDVDFRAHHNEVRWTLLAARG